MTTKTEMKSPADDLSRRMFLKLSALASAGLMFSPYSSFGKGVSGDNSSFVNGMIPACLLLQTAALAKKGTFVDQNIKNALDFSIYLTNESNFAFAGLLPHEWRVISESTFADLPKEKQAFKAGIIVSNVANEYFSKIYSNCEPNNIHELRLYHDASLIRHISQIDVTKTTKEELTRFFQTLMSPMITRTHTLRPNRDDGMDWIVKMTKWNRAYYAYAQQLAATIIAPDPAKEDMYVKKSDFLNVSDKSIRHAIEEDEFSELKEIDDNKSLFGKALYESLKQICDSFKK
jgi:hypothetical protein